MCAEDVEDTIMVRSSSSGASMAEMRLVDRLAAPLDLETGHALSR